MREAAREAYRVSKIAAEMILIWTLFGNAVTTLAKVLFLAIIS